jgi:uncharacterized protein (DUF4415 family)
MSNNRKIIMPTPEEDAAITAAALGDPDALPLTNDQLAQFKPMRRRGRPFADSTKESVTIRLSPDTVKKFKATGPGWQTRVVAALADWLKEHSPEQLDV